MSKSPKKLSKGAVKRAADRAEMRAKGETPEPEHTPIDPPEVKPTIGRPSAYKPEYAAQAAKLCKLGATDADLADFFEVSIQSIKNWKARHADFVSVLKGAKDESDDRVERSLYQRAVGYDYDAVKIFQVNGVPLLVPYREHVPPDTTAQIFWLKNRRRDQWRDVHKHEHGAPGEFDGMTPEQLDSYIHEEMKALGPKSSARKH